MGEIEILTSRNNDGLEQQTFLGDELLYNTFPPVVLCRRNSGNTGQLSGAGGKGGDQISSLECFSTVLRKSFVGCGSLTEEQLMEIGCPTNVRHVAHVTFDRFNGFLGLPAEFEPEVPRKPPSASTRVFGVSTESMQLSFDSRGNCVPTILLMMQRRLYFQGGLQSEGIFRINPENGQEEYVREQLNNGLIPDNIDVHCLAGLIKAWFRELPKGILDSVTPEQVLQAQSEDECCQIVRLLPGTEAALLDWAINLMADVAQFESINKMSARNIAMVFAPNMTKMSDPLTALMFAVQVMNFLRTLIGKTLREREHSILEPDALMQREPRDYDDGHHSNITTLSHNVRCEAAQANQAICATSHTQDLGLLSSTLNCLPPGTPETCQTKHAGFHEREVGSASAFSRSRILRVKNEQQKYASHPNERARIQPATQSAAEISEKNMGSKHDQSCKFE